VRPHPCMRHARCLTPTLDSLDCFSSCCHHEVSILLTQLVNQRSARSRRETAPSSSLGDPCCFIFSQEETSPKNLHCSAHVSPLDADHRTTNSIAVSPQLCCRPREVAPSPLLSPRHSRLHPQLISPLRCLATSRSHSSHFVDLRQVKVLLFYIAWYCLTLVSF